MSGVIVSPTKVRARLRCDRCEARWASPVYRPDGWLHQVRAAAPAFAEGWRVYVAGRGHRTYCPRHLPTVPMRLIYGPGLDNESGGHDG